MTLTLEIPDTARAVAGDEPDVVLALLGRLYRLGAVAYRDPADAGVLRVRMPRGAAPLPAELRMEIAAWKPELLELLTTHPCTRCRRFAFRAPRLCYWCANPRPSEAR